MDIKDTIKKLSQLHGVSGYEYRFSGEIEKMFSDFGYREQGNACEKIAERIVSFTN